MFFVPGGNEFEKPHLYRSHDGRMVGGEDRINPWSHQTAPLAWGFAHLCSSFDPFYKGLKNFSRVRIQSGVAENLFLPGGLSQISKNILEGNRGLAGVPGPRNS